MGLVAPSQSNPGDTIEASDINGPVNQLAAVLNGNVDSTNLADAAVSTSKLSSGAVTLAKIATGVVRLGMSTAAPGALIPNAYTTYCTVTGNSTGGEIELHFIANVHDGSSGAARTGHMRVQCDGTTVTNTDRVYYTPGNAAYAHVVALQNHTPAAGSHTWTLQVQADTVTATFLDNAALRVAEAK
jgi:hypothetical protein